MQVSQLIPAPGDITHSSFTRSDGQKYGSHVLDVLHEHCCQPWCARLSCCTCKLRAPRKMVLQACCTLLAYSECLPSKMDWTCMPHIEDLRMKTIGDCRAAPEAPAAAQLSSADVLAVADRLFAAEATWHQGSPLAQTVFTCLYLLEPHRCASGKGPAPTALHMHTWPYMCP